MTRLEVIVRPSAMDGLRELLSHPWIGGITVSEAKGFGRQKGHKEIHRGTEYTVDLLPKLKVELVVPEPLVPRVVEELTRLLRTGRIGDGKIFSEPVDDALRIRTGERGEDAL